MVPESLPTIEDPQLQMRVHTPYLWSPLTLLYCNLPVRENSSNGTLVLLSHRIPPLPITKDLRQQWAAKKHPAGAYTAAAMGSPRPRWNQARATRPPHQLEVACSPVSVQNGLVLGRHAETQGLGVSGQGALVIPAFEQLVALLPQLLGRAGLWRERRWAGQRQWQRSRVQGESGGEPGGGDRGQVRRRMSEGEMPLEDQYAPRGRKVGARGSLDYSRSSRSWALGPAQLQSLEQRWARAREGAGGSPAPAMRQRHAKEGEAKRRLRLCRGGMLGRCAGACAGSRTLQQRLVCSHWGLQGARSGDPKGEATAAGILSFSASPAAAEVQEICCHQCHQQ